MGSQALDDLRAKHRFMSKLLDMLQEQLKLIADDRQPDGQLLLEIAQYFASFPDLFHHPKEDLILRRLAVLHPGTAETIQALEAEHEEGGRELKRFVRAVVKLVLDPDADQDRFLSAALAFMENERGHMAWEEKSFFEAAERALSSQDWADVDARLQPFIKPLCQREAQTRYERVEHAYQAWQCSHDGGRAVSGIER
ncbi:MAG: hemerythrin domain-containing protein [Hyphomicrobiaceae bacterium]